MPDMKSDIKQLKGPEKAAIILMCLGDEQGGRLMGSLDEPEIMTVTRCLAGLGQVTSNVVEDVITEFLEGLSSGSGLIGNYSAAEKILGGAFDPDKVANIMRDVKGPLEGKNLWDQFSSMNEHTIANYLKSELPQTAAAILTCVKADMAAKVLPLLGTDLMNNVIKRMIVMEALPRDVLESIETTLKEEFITSAARAKGTDTDQRMADIFNKLDQELFEEVTESIEADMPDAMGRIKSKMFTFDDLGRLDAQSLGRVIRAASDGGNLVPTALKGAKPEIREFFLSCLPERAKKMMVEEMRAMGSVRKRDVQAAQSEMVDVAKTLAADNAITLPMNDEEDEIIE
jgi:flagellar motor switch protein FliG